MKRSLMDAFAFTGIFSMILLLFWYLFMGTEIALDDLLMSWFMIFLVSYVVCVVNQISGYGTKIFHAYDEDIIDDCFTHINRSSALFEQGLYLFHHNNIKEALRIFTEIDTGNYKLSQKEQGVLSFYRGRTYHLLGIFPNAVLSYEKAKENGFNMPLLPLFTARCFAADGDVDSAMKIYNSLIDTDHEFADLIRTDVGRMYLDLNEGEKALEWFQEALVRHENYAVAAGGAAIACLLTGDLDRSKNLYRIAVLNNINDLQGFKQYYDEIRKTVAPEQNDQNDRNNVN